MAKITQLLAAVSIFTGSFLLFLVQPMIGNFLLPHFGGTATVWIVCLCTFQVLLIAGYAYAHYLVGRVRLSVHVVLLFVSAAGIVPAVRFASGVSEGVSATNPVAAVIVFLLLTVAVPYILVGANASLVQSLVAKGRGGYRLYALSNIGSFVGLLGYPLLIEPRFALGLQLNGYAVGISVYALMLGCLMLGCFVAGERAMTPAPRTPLFRRCGTCKGSVSRRNVLTWFLLSAVSCFVLDAISAHLCMDVTPLPLLWCVMLALYLATWTLAFTERGSRIGSWLFPVVLVLVALAVWHLGEEGAAGYLGELKIGLALLFFGVWLIHSRLYAIRPEVSELTRYYFVIALGGAAGGVAASLVAPVAFSFVAEYPLCLAALFAVSASFFVSWLSSAASRLAPRVKTGDPQLRNFLDFLCVMHDARGTRHALLGLTVIVGAVALMRSQASDGVLVRQLRNFYGTVKVTWEQFDAPVSERAKTCLAMENNGTKHGFQLAEGDWRGASPTTYYTEVGGGQCIMDHPKRVKGEPIRAAFLGLGVGTLASYGRAGDFYRFYEINPDVARLAQDGRYFTFLKGSEARVEVVVDDARKGLEREARQSEDKYDLIAVDVFSGDSIPAHMATREAVSLYLDRLEDGGVLAFHLSNWHLGLSPLVKAVAREFSLQLVGVVSRATSLGYISYWAYLTRKPLQFKFAPYLQAVVDYSAVQDIPLMTDDFHPMIDYIKPDQLKSLKLDWIKEDRH